MRIKSTNDSLFEPDNNTRFHLIGIASSRNHDDAVQLLSSLTRSERTSLMLAAVQLAGLCAEEGDDRT